MRIFGDNFGFLRGNSHAPVSSNSSSSSLSSGPASPAAAHRDPEAGSSSSPVPGLTYRSGSRTSSPSAGSPTKSPARSAYRALSPDEQRGLLFASPQSCFHGSPATLTPTKQSPRWEAQLACINRITATLISCRLTVAACK